jgi:hypothetical protein
VDSFEHPRDLGHLSVGCVTEHVAIEVNNGTVEKAPAISLIESYCSGEKVTMLGQQDRWQDDLFVIGSLRNLIPEDHLLRRVNAFLDLGWLREEVAECYCEATGAQELIRKPRCA